MSVKELKVQPQIFLPPEINPANLKTYIVRPETHIEGHLTRREFLKRSAALIVAFVVSLGYIKEALASGENADNLTLNLGGLTDKRPEALFPVLNAKLKQHYGKDIVAAIAKNIGSSEPLNLMHALAIDYQPAKSFDFAGITLWNQDAVATVCLPHSLTGKVPTPDQKRSREYVVKSKIGYLFSNNETDPDKKVYRQNQIEALTISAVKAAIKPGEMHPQDKLNILNLLPESTALITINLFNGGLIAKGVEFTSDNGMRVLDLFDTDVLVEMINSIYRFDSGKQIVRSITFSDNLSNETITSLLLSGKLDANAAHDILANRSDTMHSAKLIMALNGSRAYQDPILKGTKKFSEFFTAEELGKITGGVIRPSIDSEDNMVTTYGPVEFAAFGWVSMLSKLEADRCAEILAETQIANSADIRGLFARYVMQEYAKDKRQHQFLRALEKKAWNKFHDAPSDDKEKKFLGYYRVWSAVYLALQKQDDFHQLGIDIYDMQTDGNRPSKLISKRNFREQKEKFRECYKDATALDVYRLLTNMQISDHAGKANSSEAVEDFLSGLEDPEIILSNYEGVYLGLATFVNRGLYLGHLKGEFLDHLFRKYDTVPVLLMGYLPKGDVVYSLGEFATGDLAPLYRAIWKPMLYYLKYGNEPLFQNTAVFQLQKTIISLMNSNLGDAAIPLALLNIKGNDREALLNFIDTIAAARKDQFAVPIRNALLGLYSRFTKGDIIVSSSAEQTMVLLAKQGIDVAASPEVLNANNLFHEFRVEIKSISLVNGSPVFNVNISKRAGGSITEKDRGTLNNAISRFFARLSGINDALKPYPVNDAMYPNLNAFKRNLFVPDSNRVALLNAIINGETVFMNVPPLLFMQAGFVTDPKVIGVFFAMENAMANRGNFRVAGDHKLKYYDRVGSTTSSGIITRDQSFLINLFSSDYTSTEIQQDLRTGKWWMRIQKQNQTDKSTYYYVKIEDLLLALE